MSFRRKFAKSILRFSGPLLGIEPPEDGIAWQATPMEARPGWRCELRNIIPFPELDGRQVVITTDQPRSLSIAVPIRVVKEAGAGL